MKTLITAALAVIAVLGVGSQAFAGYSDANGIYHQTCSNSGYQGRQICS